MSTTRLNRAVFILSVAVLGFFYGVASETFGWFPSSYMDRAFDQARALVLRVQSNEEFQRLVHTSQPPDARKTPVRRPGSVQDGLTFIASRWKELGWSPGFKLIDTKGRTLHTWRLEPGEIFSGGFPTRADEGLREHSVHGTYLFPNGDVLANVSYVGTVRLDPCGEIIWKRRTRGHHAITRADDGTFWMPASSSEPRARTPGHPDGIPGVEQPVYQEYLLRINEDGEVLRRVNVLDVLYENDLQRYIFRMNQSDDEDIIHLNDVEPLNGTTAEEYPLFEGDDLLVSLRDLNLVLVLEPESRDVKWHASTPFVKQHDPDFIGKGWIGVFNNNRAGKTGNRGEVLGGSTIVALRPHTGTRKVLFPSSRSDTFYTDIRGKWQRLENGNLLMTEAQAGRILEASHGGRTVWEWVAPTYGESYVPVVSEGTRYDLTPANVESWPCSPEQSPRGEEVRS